MGEKIEFEGEVITADVCESTEDGIVFSRRLVINPPCNQELEMGKRYRVTLEPIEPEPKACPFCHCSETTMATRLSGFVVECRRCWASGPSRMTEESAIEAWNQRADNA